MIKFNVKCPECGADNCPNNNTCIKCEQPLIGEEFRLLLKTRDLWNDWLKLPKDHPDEDNEIRTSIHRIQDLIGMRIARRTTKGILK